VDGGNTDRRLAFLGNETRGPDRMFLAAVALGPVVEFQWTVGTHVIVHSSMCKAPQQRSPAVLPPSLGHYNDEGIHLAEGIHILELTPCYISVALLLR
jgi:hypothetical protein